CVVRRATQPAPSWRVWRALADDANRGRQGESGIKGVDPLADWQAGRLKETHAMDLKGIKDASKLLRTTTAKTRTASIKAARHHRAHDQPAARRVYTDQGRRDAEQVLRQDLLGQLRDDISAAKDAAAMLRDARDLYTADAYLRTARLVTLPPE